MQEYKHETPLVWGISLKVKWYFQNPAEQVARNPSSGSSTVYHQIKGFCVWDTRVDGADTKGLIRPLSHCFGDDMSLRPRLDHVRCTHTRFETAFDNTVLYGFLAVVLCVFYQVFWFTTRHIIFNVLIEILIKIL